VRTIVPLGFGLAFGFDYGALLFIPVQLVVWFGGTLWGQLQPARGTCSLARWLGQEVLPARGEADQDVRARKREKTQALIQIVRFSRDPEERKQAIAELSRRGMVEAL
jgi:hypothetical protein